MLRKFCSLICLTKQCRFSFETMSPEDYLINQRESMMTKNIHNKSLFPLKDSNHSEGTTDEISLYGIPKGKAYEKFPEYDTFTQSLDANHPDLIFLQVSPSSYITRQRFLAHKCALKGVEDYEATALHTMDVSKPDSWEECVVNLVTLDMLEKNKVFTELDYTTGLTSYSHPYLQRDEKFSKSLTMPFINSIQKNILSEGFSDNFLINQALFSGLLGKHKVLLGDMPEVLLRQIVGNNVTIDEMRDLFKFVLEKMKDFKGLYGIKDVTLGLLPHVFQTPRDLYIAAMLKESFQAATCIVAMVGMEHFNPIQRYWVGAPYGVNYEQATTIPNRIRGETDEILIEKQAIMDVMLESRAWGAKYMSNMFPYVTEDILSVKENELNSMKKCFATNYSKYTQFKNMKLQEYRLPHQPQEFKLKLEWSKEDVEKVKDIGLKGRKGGIRN